MSVKGLTETDLLCLVASNVFCTAPGVSIENAIKTAKQIIEAVEAED